MPVDAPFTDPKLAMEICEELENNPSRHACTIQNPQGRIQPLFTAYTKSCLPVMEELISQKNYKLRFLLEPERLIPVPQRKKLRKELREALLWQGYEENYDSAIRAVFVEGAGWLSPQDVKKQRQLPLVLRYRVDGMSKDGAYLSLEVEPWEYDLLLEQTIDHYKMKKH